VVDPHTSAAVRASVLAGLVLAIRTAHATGTANVDYCAGLVAMAQHQAMAHFVPWGPLVKEARELLGDDLGELLDSVAVYVLETGR